MRVISTALNTAQQSNKRKPYNELIFNSSDGVSYDYSDRNKGIVHTEYVNNDKSITTYATIQLWNKDRAIADLTGYWIEVTYGDKFITNGVVTGMEGELTARMWVKSQNTVSFPGTVDVVLRLEGMGEYLNERPCLMDTTAPWHYNHWVETGAYGILYFALENEGFILEYPLPPDQDDGIIDTWKPDFKINETLLIPTVEGSISAITSHETVGGVIKRLMSTNYCYLRPKPGLRFDIRYPQEDEPVDETYYSYQPYWFYKFNYRKSPVIPNKFFVYCDMDFETGLFNVPLLIGFAEDEEESAKYEVTSINWALDIRNQIDADNRANLYLSNAKLRSEGGELLTPHDIRPELFDKVEVKDARV